MSKGSSGISTMVAPPAMPAQVAMWPTWRPITSTTMTRSWDSAVVWSRSMASVAICTAVSKPNVSSVPSMSLSMVLGTPTTGSPSPVEVAGAGERALAADRDHRVDLQRFIVVQHPVEAALEHVGLQARGAEHGAAPGQRAPHRPRCRARPSRRPSAPASRRGSPARRRRRCRTALRTTARMTALSPGQSPPPVRMTTRIGRNAYRSLPRAS